jgi:hypothetical protein
VAARSGLAHRRRPLLCSAGRVQDLKRALLEELLGLGPVPNLGRLIGREELKLRQVAPTSPPAAHALVRPELRSSATPAKLNPARQRS